MCLLTLHSTNPKLGWIIYKNPNSGMIARPIRKGIGYGFYAKDREDTYVVYFRDAEGETSFKKSVKAEFEYLDNLRFTTPIFVMNAVYEFFSSTVKKVREEDTEEYEHKLCVNIVQMKGNVKNMFTKIAYHFSDVEVDIQKPNEKVIGVYTVTIKTKTSLNYLINFTKMIFSVISCVSTNDMYMNVDNFKSMLACVNAVKAPYYVRYLLASRVITRNKVFTEVKELLEQCPGHTVDMVCGNTAMQRINFIQKQIDFTKPIVDVGCGDGFYVIPFAKMLHKKKIPYYAVDVDEGELVKLQKKIKKEGLDNVHIFTNHMEMIREVGEDTEVDVIVTEVIEHMSVEESQILLLDLLCSLNYTQIVVTTPNSDFNHHYLLKPGEFRHLDHKWEYSGGEFKRYVYELLTGHPEILASFVKIGDSVDNVTPTQGIVLTKIET